MKRRENAGRPISSKITVTKEKETRKRKSEDEERGSREKSNGCTFSIYNGYFGDTLIKGPFALTFSKIRLDNYLYIITLFLLPYAIRTQRNFKTTGGILPFQKGSLPCRHP